MKVIKIAKVPPPTVQIDQTIKEAVPAMGSQHGCAVAVLDGNRLVGTLSRDEVLARVVGSGLNAAETKVREVMSSPADTVSTDTEAEEAIKWMFANQKCYLGVVDREGTLKGWLAICSLFQDHVEDLTRELDSLAAYYSADGSGG
jgi:CBS-domain-containing membrane protein